jgi:hypothetical protein
VIPPTHGGGGSTDPRQTVYVENGYGYGVIGADLHVFRDRGPVYLLTEFRPREEPRTDLVPEQPSRLLNARYQVVDFTGRGRELAHLTAWRDTSPPQLAARLLHGPGGQGKTRLAAQFAERSAAAGWKVVTAIHGPSSARPSPGSQDLSLDSATGLVLILDYADRWPLSHLDWLFSNALFHQPLPTRLLLLGRSAQSWPGISASLEDLGADTSVLPLKPLARETGLATRKRMFRVARDCFAAHYGLSDPTSIEPPKELKRQDFGLVLALHMAALAAVDAHQHGVRPPASMADLSAYLLKREATHWRRLHGNESEGLDFRTAESVMARTVFAACLTGATTYARGKALLDELDLEIPSSRVLADHATCYPPATAGTVLEPLYPDRLAEDFLALYLPGHEVTSHPPAAWAPFTAQALTAARADDGGPEQHITRSLTFLAAAAAPARWPHVAAPLQECLRADPSLAVAAGSPFLTALAAIPDPDAALLEAVAAHFPENRHTDLDPGIASVTERLARYQLARTADDATKIRILNDLRTRLSYAGRVQEALEATQQAVNLMRPLASADPETYAEQLAGALGNLANRLAGVGHRTESLMTQREAVALCRPLAGANPRAYEAPLANHLANLGASLTDAGLPQEAYQVLREASSLFLRLAEENPAHMRGLASTISNTAAAMAATGAPDYALATERQAVELWRTLALANPATYRPELALGLSNLGGPLLHLGRTEEALMVIQEAVDLYRDVAAANPRAYLPELAGALANLSFGLGELGRHEEALTAAREAVDLYRGLGQSHPHAFRAGLANALTCLAVDLARTGHPDEALAASRETMALHRDLAQSEPRAFRPGLAAALVDLAADLEDHDLHEEALTTTREAVAIYEQLATENPDAFDAHLARSLRLLIRRAAKAGPEEERREMQNAEKIFRRLHPLPPTPAT